MRRPREYIKAKQLDSEFIAINFIRSKNDGANADISSAEIIDFAARLFQLASKRGRVKSTVEEVLDEAI